jgi:hypothetical protein
VDVGVGALPLRSSLVAFFLARSVFNTLMVLGSKPVTSSLADLIAGRVTWQSILVSVGSIAGYAVFLKLPWSLRLGLEQSSGSNAGKPGPTPGA